MHFIITVFVKDLDLRKINLKFIRLSKSYKNHENSWANFLVSSRQYIINETTIGIYYNNSIAEVWLSCMLKTDEEDYV